MTLTNPSLLESIKNKSDLIKEILASFGVRATLQIKKPTPTTTTEPLLSWKLHSKGIANKTKRTARLEFCTTNKIFFIGINTKLGIGHTESITLIQELEEVGLCLAELEKIDPYLIKP